MRMYAVLRKELQIMAERSEYQQGVVKRYYENRDTLAVQNLGEIVSDLYLCKDAKKAARLWERVAKALQHTDAHPAAVQQVLRKKDVGSLSQLITELAVPPRKSRTTPPATTPLPAHRSPATSQQQGSTESIAPTDAQLLRRAMNAFKKRIKLTRLDDESRLGRGALTGGKDSGLVAITPPSQFPEAVWEELVNRGKLKRAGSGFYALVPK